MFSIYEFFKSAHSLKNWQTEDATRGMEVKWEGKKNLQVKKAALERGGLKKFDLEREWRFYLSLLKI